MCEEVSCIFEFIPYKFTGENLYQPKPLVHAGPPREIKMPPQVPSNEASHDAGTGREGGHSSQALSNERLESVAHCVKPSEGSGDGDCKERATSRIDRRATHGAGNAVASDENHDGFETTSRGSFEGYRTADSSPHTNHRTLRTHPGDVKAAEVTARFANPKMNQSSTVHCNFLQQSVV